MSPWNPFAIWFVTSRRQQLRKAAERAGKLADAHHNKLVALTGLAAVEDALERVYRDRQHKLRCALDNISTDDSFAFDSQLTMPPALN